MATSKKLTAQCWVFFMLTILPCAAGVPVETIVNHLRNTILPASFGNAPYEMAYHLLHQRWLFFPNYEDTWYLYTVVAVASVGGVVWHALATQWELSSTKLHVVWVGLAEYGHKVDSSIRLPTADMHAKSPRPDQRPSFSLVSLFNVKEKTATGKDTKEWTATVERVVAPDNAEWFMHALSPVPVSATVPSLPVASPAAVPRLAADSPATAPRSASASAFAFPRSPPAPPSNQRRSAAASLLLRLSASPDAPATPLAVYEARRDFLADQTDILSGLKGLPFLKMPSEVMPVKLQAPRASILEFKKDIEPILIAMFGPACVTKAMRVRGGERMATYLNKIAGFIPILGME